LFFQASSSLASAHDFPIPSEAGQTNGIQLRGSISFGVPKIMEGGLSTTLSFSETMTKTEAQTVSSTNTTDIPIAPEQIAKVTVTLFEYVVSVPWTATIRMRGTVHSIGDNGPNTSIRRDPSADVFNMLHNPASKSLTLTRLSFKQQGCIREFMRKLALGYPIYADTSSSYARGLDKAGF
jgi:hypothetical protein